MDRQAVHRWNLKSTMTIVKHSRNRRMRWLVLKENKTDGMLNIEWRSQPRSNASGSNLASEHCSVNSLHGEFDNFDFFSNLN